MVQKGAERWQKEDKKKAKRVQKRGVGGAVNDPIYTKYLRYLNKKTHQNTSIASICSSSQAVEDTNKGEEMAVSLCWDQRSFSRLCKRKKNSD